MENNTWPLPVFYFRVTIAGQPADFREVSGLDAEAQGIEYRHAESPAINMPGLKKHGNVTLKRGIFNADTTFWDWQNQIKMNTIRREEVMISLLDDQGTAVMTWTLRNAWPTKVTGIDTKADGKVAVDTVELAHEGITLTNG